MSLEASQTLTIDTLNTIKTKTKNKHNTRKYNKNATQTNFNFFLLNFHFLARQWKIQYKIYIIC